MVGIIFLFIALIRLAIFAAILTVRVIFFMFMAVIYLFTAMIKLVAVLLGGARR